MKHVAHILGLTDYEGKDVHFGFRPEAIVLGEQDNSYVLNAKVELP